MRRLLACLTLFLLSSWPAAADTFTSQWFFSESPFAAPAVKQVYITTLWTVTESGTNIAIGAQRYRLSTDTNSSLTISNMIPGGYRVEYQGPFSTVIFTNSFGTNVTGTVNAKNHISAALPVNGTTTAYSQAQSDARYYPRTNNPSNYLRSTNSSGSNAVFNGDASLNLPRLHTSNLVIRAAGPTMSVTNDGTTTVVDFSNLTNGNVRLQFSGTPGDGAYGYFEATADHDGSASPGHTELRYVSPNSFAIGVGAHLQWGAGVGSYWSYTQGGRVDTSVAGALGIGMPWTYRVSWNSNGVLRSRFPGTMPLATSTNGGTRLVFLHDLGNDSTFDSWGMADIVPAGWTYDEPGNIKGWNLRGGLRQQLAAGTISTAAYALDFGTSFAQDLSIGVTNAVFSLTNDVADTTNFESRVFIVRSRGFVPTLSWPQMIGANSLPASMNNGQIFQFQIDSFGPGVTNKTVHIINALATDPTWSWDTDATNFFARAAVTATAAQSNALNNLVLNLKASGSWYSNDVINPAWGGTSNSHAQYLKTTGSPGITFTATGWTHDASGFKGNGTTAYGNTGYIPTTHGAQYTQNSASLFVYCGTASSSGHALSTVNGASTKYAALIANAGAGGWQANGLNNASGNPTVSAGGDFRGAVLLTRTGSTTSTLYFGALSGSDSTASVGLPDHAFYVGARNPGDDGAGDNFGNMIIQGFMIGGAKSASLKTSEFAAWQQYQQEMGR